MDRCRIYRPSFRGDRKLTYDEVRLARSLHNIGYSYNLIARWFTGRKGRDVNMGTIRALCLGRTYREVP
jgi:hypothetical protein